MKLNWRMLSAVLLAVCTVVFGSFFAVVYLSEHNVVVDHQESCISYAPAADFSYERWGDSTAPAGVREEYRWRRMAGEYDGASIAFYLVHQSTQVYYNDELVYSVSPDPDNRLTNTPGSNWVMLPLHDASHDCDIRVVITPHFEDIAGRRVEILVGSLYSIFLDVLQQNLLYVVLSLLALLMGSVMLLACVYNAFLRRKLDDTVVYMAITMLLIGLWRITDTKLSAFLFPGNVLALDYITIGSLFLMCGPFVLATRSRIRRYMYPLSVISAVMCLAVMIGHLLDWWEMRRLLVLSHGMIIINAAALMVAEGSVLRHSHSLADAAALMISLAPVLGALADMVYFYVTDSSAGVVYVIVGFMVYALYSFATSLREARRRMFTDAQTGLYNRARWESLMEEAPAGSGGIIIFDMTRLKQVNDRMGHEAGDQMIGSFAQILRRTLGPGAVICRWGGDEFTVYVPDASDAMLQRILQNVKQAVAVHNRSQGELFLQYAAGCAADGDRAGLPLRELFRLADERMYQNKKGAQRALTEQ